MSHNDDRCSETLAVRVTELCGDLRDRLPSHWVSTAEELLQNDEPNEALLQLSWGIAEEQVAVDETILTFIETAVGDPLDLPADLTGATRPVRSRRSATPTRAR